MKEITTYQNEIPKVFKHDELGELRVITIDGDPWFIAKDICLILNLKNTCQTVNRLDEEERRFSPVKTHNGERDMSVVNESGLYSLLLTTKKSQAKAFKRWVIKEVIPSIRSADVSSFDARPSRAELLLEQLQNIVAMEKRQKEIEQKINALQSDFDDNKPIENENSCQKLSALINGYVKLKGIQYQKGWLDFVNNYNNVHNTNLVYLQNNYQQKYDLKELSIPEYLEITGNLKDAIRIAEKMLNQAAMEIK